LEHQRHVVRIYPQTSLLQKLARRRVCRGFSNANLAPGQSESVQLVFPGHAQNGAIPLDYHARGRWPVAHLDSFTG
jgi:hypothetical protein